MIPVGVFSEKRDLKDDSRKFLCLETKSQFYLRLKKASTRTADLCLKPEDKSEFLFTLKDVESIKNLDVDVGEMKEKRK